MITKTIYQECLEAADIGSAAMFLTLDYLQAALAGFEGSEATAPDGQPEE